MDDYNINSVIDSKNEWSARLTTVLTPCVIEGIKSIFEEAYKICYDNDEESKYLMTFQNLLNNIPKWSSQIVEQEKERILTNSCCHYLEDLITCVHITQLKSLTCSRVGLKQKKININIPDLNSFIHKVYINVARKVYVNVYLFEKDIMPLQIQKNNRELETIIKECILNTTRENIPVEEILKIYLDETQETDVEVEETKEIIPDKESIDRKQKLQKQKELDEIKNDVAEKVKKESKSNLKKALKDANKSMNENLIETSNKSDTESNKSDYETDEDSNCSEEKLTIHNNEDTLNDLDLKIKTLDEDPDKLDLDILDIDTEVNNDDPPITLDIEELQ